jgi:DNA polymerase III alpha subunit
MVRAKARAKTVLIDFTSVPKIIGIGPIIITPAPRTLPFFVSPIEAIITAITMTMIPTTINVMPRIQKTARPHVIFHPQIKKRNYVFNKRSRQSSRMQKIKSSSTSLSCRRKMTTQELIQEILLKNPLINQEQILEKIEAERIRTGGLLSDETILRLIAAKFGVQVKQKTIHNSGVLPTSRLFAGLYDVTVEGRLIAVFHSKTFQGSEKSGKIATLMIADNEGVLRVVLWNEKAELVERGALKAGQTVRLIHGYTRNDRYGKTELHLSEKGEIEAEPQTKEQYPSVEKFTTKIGVLDKSSGCVHLSGAVKTVLGTTLFTRSDGSEGKVMRLMLADDSGEVNVVVWNEKTLELENLRVNARLVLVNVRVKETQDGVEVHVDTNTFVNVN